MIILDFIFESIHFLKQLPDFSSCCVFGTYPGFETITGFQLMSRFRNLSWFWDNYWISAHFAFSEHILVLRLLPDFSSCRVFGTYPGFETITGIHINVNFQVFSHLRNKTRFFDKVKYKQNKKTNWAENFRMWYP